MDKAALNSRPLLEAYGASTPFFNMPIMIWSAVLCCVCRPAKAEWESTACQFEGLGIYCSSNTRSAERNRLTNILTNKQVQHGAFRRREIEGNTEVEGCHARSCMWAKSRQLLRKPQVVGSSPTAGSPIFPIVSPLL